MSDTTVITMDYMSWYYQISHIFLSLSVLPVDAVGYHHVDENYRQFIGHQYHQREYACTLHTRPDHMRPSTWTRNEGEPGPSSSYTAYTTPPVVSSMPLYDYGYHTPFVGSFTQLLQSDFHPTLNTSPIPYQEYLPTPGYEVDDNVAGTSTVEAQTHTEGDNVEEANVEILGRGHRVIIF